MTDEKFITPDNLSEGPQCVGTPPVVGKKYVKPSNEGMIETSLKVTATDEPSLKGHSETKNASIAKLNVRNLTLLNRPNRGTRNSMIHFMNACREQNSVFTCAVDSFLETCFVAIGSYIPTIAEKSPFFEILDAIVNQYNVITVV